MLFAKLGQKNSLKSGVYTTTYGFDILSKSVDFITYNFDIITYGLVTHSS